MSQAITIREVNQHTSAAFKRVIAGEELIVTNHGTPVARILPYRPSGIYEQLVADGRITPATVRTYHAAPTMSWSPMVEDAIEAERAEHDWLDR